MSKQLRVRCFNGDIKKYGPFDTLADVDVRLSDGTLVIQMKTHMHMLARGFWQHAWTEDIDGD